MLGELWDLIFEGAYEAKRAVPYANNARLKLKLTADPDCTQLCHEPIAVSENLSVQARTTGVITGRGFQLYKESQIRYIPHKVCRLGKRNL